MDVTEAFHLTGNGSEKLAIFELGSSPIVVGRNVLKTSVDGIVLDTTRTASDGVMPLPFLCWNKLRSVYETHITTLDRKSVV